MDPKDTPPSSWYDPPDRQMDCKKCDDLDCDDGKLVGWDGDGAEVIEDCPCLLCHRPDEWEAAQKQEHADFLYELSIDR